MCTSAVHEKKWNVPRCHLLSLLRTAWHSENEISAEPSPGRHEAVPNALVRDIVEASSRARNRHPSWHDITNAGKNGLFESRFVGPSGMSLGDIIGVVFVDGLGDHPVADGEDVRAQLGARS